jgi:hypothetical protein
MNGIPQQTIPITPVPCQIHLLQAQLPTGDIVIVLVVDDVTGRKVAHLSPEQALIIGDGMVKYGKAGRVLIASGSQPILPFPVR